MRGKWLTEAELEVVNDRDGNRGNNGCGGDSGGDWQQRGQATINNKRQCCVKESGPVGGGNRAAVPAVAAAAAVAVAAVVVAVREMMVGHWVDLWQSLSFFVIRPKKYCLKYCLKMSTKIA